MFVDFKVTTELASRVLVSGCLTMHTADYVTKDRVQFTPALILPTYIP